MHARQDQGSPHSGGNAPPWVSSFYSALSASAAAAANSASASTTDDDDGDSTTSTGLSSSQSDTASTTPKTSIGLDSTSIVLSTSSTSMNFLPTSVATGPSISLSPISANPHTWPPSSLTFSNGQSASASPVPTQAWESLSSTPSPSESSVASSISTATEPTALPNDTPSASRDRHAFNGAILAAIIVPIAILSLLGLALIICLRRRRRLAQGVLLRPVAEAKEEAFTKRGPADVQVHDVQPPQPHLIMSPQNGSYFTGLETMSMMSAEPRASSNEDPPPPYRSRSEATARSPSVRSAFSSVAMPPPALVNLGSPISPLDSMSVAEDSPFNDPPAGVSRVASSRSITSTLYSSNASLAEARPARRGMVRPNVVDVDERSPFADPEPDTDSDDQ